MKFGNIVKGFNLTQRDIETDLNLINQYSRKDLREEDVYLFPVVLCDNEIDRDGEKFSVKSLKKLSELFLGKTGIFDHYPTANNQVSRIYDTAVVEDKAKTTKDKETYQALVAWAYIAKTEKTEDLIAEIDAGIKKEVSVGCAVDKCICSICGADKRIIGCEHRNKKTYDGKLAFAILEDPTDAYEWSFVAVPAQTNAGVIKKFNTKESEEQDMFNQETLDKIKSFIDEGKQISITKKDEIFEVSEVTEVKAFITAEMVTEKAGKEMTADEVLKSITDVETLTAEKATLTADKEALETLKSAYSKTIENLEKEVKAYENIRTKALETALTNGIKAKGDSFDKDRWTKLLKDFSMDEIEAQSTEWLDEAKIRLNAGKRFSAAETKSTSDKKEADVDDYKI